MCFGGNNPRAPDAPPPPQAPQDPQIADLADARKKRQANSGMAGGTLLTGSTGIENSQLNTGGPANGSRGSLLGS